MKNILQKNINFSSDNFRLSGTLHIPNIKRPPVVFGSHGLLSDSSSPKQIALADKLNSLGIAFFRFDFRGCGNSEGRLMEVTNLEARNTDLLNAVKAVLRREETGKQIGFFGSSFGGTVSLCATATKFRKSPLVTIAAPVRSALIDQSIKTSDTFNNNIELLNSRRFQFDISKLLKNIQNILLFHGDCDEVVPITHAYEIYKKAKKPKKMSIQKTGDHRMSNKIHQIQFLNDAASWFKSSLKN